MNAMPKYVVSNSLSDADASWHNSTVVRGDAAAEVRALKDAVAGDLLVAGSASLVQTLVEQSLVDEFRLMLFPIVLGSGKRLFGDVSEPPVFVLDGVSAIGAGIVILTYHPAPAGSARENAA
jgi:dihydrofolate reductase